MTPTTAADATARRNNGQQPDPDAVNALLAGDDHGMPIGTARPAAAAQPATARQAKDRFPLVTSAALDTADYTPRWIIEDMLAAGSPAVDGGLFKTGKSLIAIDGAISVASGTRFLGRFAVPDPLAVVYFSGEGGPSVAQEYGRRIAASKGLALGDVTNLRWCFTIPKLESLPDLDAIRRIHDATAAELMVFDNLMLCMSADEPGNVFRMGQTLANVITLCTERGITPQFVHHFKRTRATAGQYDPGELADLTQAGAAEVAGQWWLLTRRSRYNPDNAGEHELWMTVGGRVGHSSLHALNIHEGRRKDPGGRRWEVEILSAGDVRESQYREAEEAKQAEHDAKQADKLEDAKTRIVRAAARHADGETATVLRDSSGLKPEAFRPALAALIDEGALVPCDVLKPNRKTPYQGYTLSTHE